MVISDDHINVEVWQHTLQMQTDPALFSPRQADRGTLAMLSLVLLQPHDTLLDLGCGYGIVGIAAAKVLGTDQVVLIDVDPVAVRTARVNARINGLPDLEVICGDGPAATDKKFSQILSNPPYHTDFSVAKRFIEIGYEHLLPGGRLWLVVKRLEWYKMKMKHIFAGVQVYRIDGYYVLMAERRDIMKSTRFQIVQPEKTTRKHKKRQQSAAAKYKVRNKKKMPSGGQTAVNEQTQQ